MRGFGLFRNLFKGEVKEPSERRQDSRVDAREGLRILIVDDSATVVAVLGRMLTQAKYDAYATDSGEAALESLNTRIPELIFLDIVLPGMSGFAALRALRRDPRTAHVPVIMISGNLKATEEFYGQRIGADDFMKKPFGRTEVFSRIQRLIESGRLEAREVAEEPVETQDDETLADETVPSDHDIAGVDHAADASTVDDPILSVSDSAAGMAPMSALQARPDELSAPEHVFPARAAPDQVSSGELPGAPTACGDESARDSRIALAAIMAAPGESTESARAADGLEPEPILITPTFDDSPFPDPLQDGAGNRDEGTDDLAQSTAATPAQDADGHQDNAAADAGAEDPSNGRVPGVRGNGAGSADALSSSDAPTRETGDDAISPPANPPDDDELHPALRPEVRDPDSKLLYEPPWERD